ARNHAHELCPGDRYRPLRLGAHERARGPPRRITDSQATRTFWISTMPDQRTNGHPIDGSRVARRSTPDRPAPDRTTDHPTSERMPHHQRTRAQERADEIDVSPTKLLAEVEGLRAEVESARRESDEYKALLQRERAE